MKIVSACFLGIKCRHDGNTKPNEKVIALMSKEVLIPVCPEQLGGLPTPRARCEINGTGGDNVIDGNGTVVDPDGNDHTNQYLKGAQEVLKIARMCSVKEVILKQKSPSCGCGMIYDGTFSGRLKEGDGVTTAFLKKNGITVFSEDDL